MFVAEIVDLISSNNSFNTALFSANSLVGPACISFFGNLVRG